MAQKKLNSWNAYFWPYFTGTRFFNGKGRASRTEYYAFVNNVGLSFLVLGSCGTFLTEKGFISQDKAGFFYLILFFVFFIAHLSCLVRRLHDTGRSGWWILTVLPPLVFIFLSGDKKKNRYGEPPVVVSDDEDEEDDDDDEDDEDKPVKKMDSMNHEEVDGILSKYGWPLVDSLKDASFKDFKKILKNAKPDARFLNALVISLILINKEWQHVAKKVAHLFDKGANPEIKISTDDISGLTLFDVLFASGKNDPSPEFANIAKVLYETGLTYDKETMQNYLEKNPAIMSRLIKYHPDVVSRRQDVYDRLNVNDTINSMIENKEKH